MGANDMSHVHGHNGGRDYWARHVAVAVMRAFATPKALPSFLPCGWHVAAVRGDLVRVVQASPQGANAMRRSIGERGRP